MINSGYELHLYCRNEAECAAVVPGTSLCGFYGHFFHEKKTMAYARAMKAGWRFRDGDVTCPTCVKRYGIRKRAK